MRAVTFSTPEVQNVLANHFVSLNSNIAGESTAGESIGHSPDEVPGDCIRGNGRQNVQTIFMTPDLEILHVATGFVSPAELLAEMQFAVELFEKLKEETDNRFDLVRASHSDSQLRSRLAKQVAKIREANPTLRVQKSPLATRMTGGGGTPLSLAAQDDQYLIQRPLISMATFQQDPGKLVGRGNTFFSSTSNARQTTNRR